MTAQYYRHPSLGLCTVLERALGQVKVQFVQTGLVRTIAEDLIVPAPEIGERDRVEREHAARRSSEE